MIHVRHLGGDLLIWTENTIHVLLGTNKEEKNHSTVHFFQWMDQNTWKLKSSLYNLSSSPFLSWASVFRLLFCLIAKCSVFKKRTHFIQNPIMPQCGVGQGSTFLLNVVPKRRLVLWDSFYWPVIVYCWIQHWNTRKKLVSPDGTPLFRDGSAGRTLPRLLNSLGEAAQKEEIKYKTTSPWQSFYSALWNVDSAIC